LLGREASWRGTHPALGTRNALFPLQNAALELLSPGGDAPAARALRGRLDDPGEGLLALAFACDDADETCRAWRAAGLPAADPTAGEGRAGDATRRWRNVHLHPAATRSVPLLAIEREGEPLPPAPLRAEDEAAVSRLDHVVVLSPAPDAARALYGDALGLRLSLDREFPAFRSRLLFFRVGGATVEIGARLGEPARPDAPDRLWGLAWSVPDADAARARLWAAGVDVSPVRPGRKPGTRVCSVRSAPGGVPTLLVEPARSESAASART